MTGLDRGLHAGLAALRFGLLAWLAVVTVVQRDDLGRPALAWALVGITFAWSIIGALIPRPVPAGDLVVSAMLLAADRHVYDGPHAQTFGGAWPLVGPIAAGLAWGPAGGAAGGAALGLARWAGSDGSAVISLVSSAVFYVLAGALTGYLVDRLRRAETEVAAARAREDVARRLHDGVLQTLAVVQRRSGDADLARLARQQERELREWLFGAARRPRVGRDRPRRGAADRGGADRGSPRAARRCRHRRRRRLAPCRGGRGDGRRGRRGAHERRQAR